VREAYMLAWNLGCLGITIFRDGSKGEQVLNVGVKDAKQEGEQQAPSEAAATEEAQRELPPETAVVAVPSKSVRFGKQYVNGVKVRPEVVQGYTRQVRSPEGKVNITLNCDEDGLLEVFVNVGKAGSDVAALAEALGRLISLHLRIDSPLTQDERAAEVARQLASIGGSTSIGFGQSRVRSLPDAVARALELHLAGAAKKDGDASDAPASTEATEATETGAGHAGSQASGFANGNGHGFAPGTLALYTVTGNLCPQCGNNTLHMEEGCKKCVSCGYSEC
jgi:ribonucleoside-diphosphate reductase alpha chain